MQFIRDCIFQTVSYPAVNIIHFTDREYNSLVRQPDLVDTIHFTENLYGFEKIIIYQKPSKVLRPCDSCWTSLFFANDMSKFILGYRLLGKMEDCDYLFAGTVENGTAPIHRMCYMYSSTA